MQKIREHMLTEHVQLEQLWDIFLTKRNCEEAEEVFQKFIHHSSRHLEMEDAILFPLLNKSLGLEKGVGPIQVTDYEHKNMIRLLSQIESSLRTGDFTKTCSLGFHFKKALLKHQVKEEERQYSLLNSFVSISSKDWEEMLSGVYKSKSKKKIIFFSKQKISSLLRRLKKVVRKFLERARSQK